MWRELDIFFFVLVLISKVNVVIAQVASQRELLRFTVWKDHAIFTDTKVINVCNVVSTMHCAMLCLGHPQCIGANLEIPLMKCQLREKEYEGTGRIFLTNSTSQTALIADGEEWDCYEYTSQTYYEMTLHTEQKVCEQYGRVLTYGNNADYVGCGTCWCCKPNDIAVVEYTNTWRNFGASDCYVARSHEYSGTASTTISGHTCQRWNESYPHSPSYQPYYLSDKSSDYCRASTVDEIPWCYTTSTDKRWEYCSIVPCFACDVLDNLPTSPTNTTYVVSVRQTPIVSFQCKTLQPGTSQTHCPVSRCIDNEWTKNYTMSCTTEDCYTVSQDYMGTVACTISGIPCQVWNSSTPHSPSYWPSDIESLGSNFCRDPSNDGAPWCYTMDSDYRWEFCPVPKC